MYRNSTRVRLTAKSRILNPSPSSPLCRATRVRSCSQNPVPGTGDSGLKLESESGLPTYREINSISHIANCIHVYMYVCSIFNKEQTYANYKKGSTCNDWKRLFAATTALLAKSVTVQSDQLNVQI